jgi:hypothetical protein
MKAETPQPAAERSVEPKSGFSAPSISLPKGGGAIRGIGEKFAANPVTGTASLTIPIPASLVADPADCSRVFVWLLERSYNDKRQPDRVPVRNGADLTLTTR